MVLALGGIRGSRDRLLAANGVLSWQRRTDAAAGELCSATMGLAGAVATVPYKQLLPEPKDVEPWMGSRYFVGLSVVRPNERGEFAGLAIYDEPR